MVELGESKVPLTEDVIKRTDEFEQTFFEFIARDGIQINRRAELTSSTTTTLYTVPIGQVFYLMNSNLSSFCNGGGGAGTGGAFISTSQHATLLTIRMDQTIVSSTAFSTQYPYGLKFQEGESITLGLNVTNSQCFGSIQGFEIAKESAFRR